MTDTDQSTTTVDESGREVPGWLTYFVVLSATLGASGAIDGAGRLSLLKLSVVLAIAISYPLVVRALGPATGGIWSLSMTVCMIAITFTTVLFIDDGADLNDWAEYGQGVALFAIIAASRPLVVGRAWVVAVLLNGAALIGELTIGLRYTPESSFDRYLAVRQIEGASVRVFSGNPNNLAAFLFLSCLGLLLVAFRDPNPRWRRASTLAVVAALVGIALTGSRLAFLATMILALSLGLVAAGSLRVRARQVIIALFVGGVVLVIPLFLGGTTLGAAKLQNFLKTELSDLLRGDTGTSSSRRVHLLRGGFDAMADRWYLGSGAGSFEGAIEDQRDPALLREVGDPVVNAHNLMLEIAVEVGLLVALLFGLAWLLTVLKEGTRMVRTKDLFAAAAFGTMAGSALISALPSSVIGLPAGWMFIGTYVAIRRSPYRTYRGETDRVESGRRVRREDSTS